MTPKGPRLGIWLVGARGGVGTTTIVGALAIRKGLSGTIGMITELEDFHGLGLAPLSEIEIGGWEVRPGTLLDSAREIGERTGTIRESWLRELADGLARVDREIRPGSVSGCGEVIASLAGDASRVEPPAALLERAVGELSAFREERGLDEVVVVNVASTEPPVPIEDGPLSSWDRFERDLGSGGSRLPASAVYAAAALEAGCPYVNFTPSTGSSCPALAERALARGLPHMGRDGKTGETWLKTVLAPAFVARNLRVLSWEGHNILGDRDGKVLANPENARGKLADKDEALRAILGDPEAHSRVRIDYVPSLDDWKTAWDFIHFQGFLGVKMQLQLLWQGCDAILAAPMILDLARLAAFAKGRGEAGLLPHLACFFKSPTGVSEHAFARQIESLLAYVRARRLAEGAAGAAVSPSGIRRSGR